MGSRQDVPKTLTVLETELLYAIWYATAANVPPGLKYKEMLRLPNIEGTSMAMLKKTVQDLESRSLITSHADGSRAYPDGRRPQVYRLDYDHVPATLGEAAMLVTIHGYIQPPLFFDDLLNLIRTDFKRRKLDVEDPTILLRKLKHAYDLNYVRDRLESTTSEVEIRGTPRLRAHITYLHKIVYKPEPSYLQQFFSEG
jgi:hypothetical protein